MLDAALVDVPRVNMHHGPGHSLVLDDGKEFFTCGLAELAIPMLILLLAQTILMWLFANFVTFRVMGRDYDAAELVIPQLAANIQAR